ncbi:glutamine synthetase family protein [Streptomyces sp. B6B3]|uniref:glutamine synthetase family protein n=1 Tax=Streptomyces sp. B6B3 TaxID=3153570 RepID=UPI00325D126B
MEMGDMGDVAGRLGAAGVRGVALTWVDNAGLTRVKTVPVGRLADAARRGVGMSPVFDVYLVDDSMTSSPHVGGPDGDLRLRPDLDRLTVLAGQPGWAWAPVDRYRQDGAEYPACQRLFARRQVARAREEHGVELRMGFETEWVVTRPPREPGGEPGGEPGAGGEAAEAADRELRYPCAGPAYGMTRLVELSGYLSALMEAATAQDLGVLQLHPEYAPGQFEISVAPADPVGAADLAVLVRETVRAVSVRHGLAASFAPVVDPAGVGSGRHLHLSLWRGDRNLCGGGTGPHGMTGECEAFLAGVLRELPALLALGAPSPASYLRLRPSHWAGVFGCWGLENREAALRFVAGEPDRSDAANAEVKCFDGAANPYLVVGAVIAAGLAGLEAGLSLPPPVSGDPAAGPEEGRPPRLPESLAEALRHFEDSAVLREALGEPLFGAVAAVRRAEIELFADATPREIAAATRARY